MDMQDKELDKLFQSSLEGLEIEPSAHVWGEIAGKLDAAKRKRSIVPFLSIAAGVLLLLTAGLLFVPEVNNHTDPVKVTKNEIPVKTSPVIKATPAAVLAYQQNKRAVKAVIAPVSNAALLKTKMADKKETHKINKQDTVGERSTDEPELALAAYRGNQVGSVISDDKDEVNLPVNNLLARANNQPQLTAQLPRPKPRGGKKHRIRSLGDVLNVVIAAVDKREDKFIEFSNTDEDDATITGLNLGIIKVKKEK
jgi:hypothetical protein